MSQQLVLPSGTTELRVEGMTYNWEIKNVDRLANPKIRSLCKLRSPTFIAGNFEERAKEWHLELSHTKNDWMKCTLVPESMASSQETPTTTRGLSSILAQGVGNNMTPSQLMEKSTGSFVYSVSLIKNDGSTETFKDLIEKSEEIDGWTVWASKFCEKRRKMGCVEFLFGENNDSSVNAIPMDYVWEKRDQYVFNNSLRLKVELLFTHDVAEITVQNENHSNNELYQMAIDGERLGLFHNNELFSDLRLKCGHRTFPVHKLMLMAKAEHFANHILARLQPAPNIASAAAADHLTAEGKGHHAGDVLSSSAAVVNVDTVLIEDLQPDVLDLILEFIYKTTIPEGMCLHTLSNLAKAAKAYQIESLTQYIEPMLLNEGRRT